MEDNSALSQIIPREVVDGCPPQDAGGPLILSDQAPSSNDVDDSRG
jgi:hypothetical protein